MSAAAVYLLGAQHPQAVADYTTRSPRHTLAC